MKTGVHGKIIVSDTGRYLVREGGAPFLYIGDTAWEIFHRLNRAEAELYLSDRSAKGFTVVQGVLVSEIDGVSSPNAEGNLPFHDRNPLAPVESYFRHVDWIVARANKLGLVMAVLPAWGSHWACSETSQTDANLGDSKTIFTLENAEAYGKWLGERYRDADLIWVLGGDRNLNNDRERAVQDALARGLRAGDAGNHLMTFHPRGPGRSSEEAGNADWLDFNMCQTSHATAGHDTGLFIEADYDLEPVKPVLDGEPRYESIPIGFYNQGNNPAVRFNDYHCRTAAWWAILAGACGHTYGNNNIWQMYDTGKDPAIHAAVPWHEALHHPGAIQMGYLRRLLESLEWWNLVPVRETGLHSFLVDAPNHGPAKVRAAMARDRSFALVYSPKGKPFTLALHRFAPQLIEVSWFNPRYGTAHPCQNAANRSFQTFDPPTHDGENDWVLILKGMVEKA
jgi:hypothetical protein